MSRREKEIVVKSKIRIACNICKTNDIYVRLSSFIGTGGYTCKCNKRKGKRLTWHGEDGFSRLVTICKKRNVTPMLGDQEIDLQIWIRNREFLSNAACVRLQQRRPSMTFPEIR